MIRDWLTPDKINVINAIDNWKNAVRLAAEPLLAQGYMAEHYIEAILKSHAELGPYYLLAPGLAMPHARPEQGALRNGLSLLHGFVNGMVASHLLCHSGTINRHSLNGALLS